MRCSINVDEPSVAQFEDYIHLSSKHQIRQEASWTIPWSSSRFGVPFDELLLYDSVLQEATHWLHLQGLQQSPIQVYPHANLSVCEGRGVSHADAHFEAC